MNIKKILLLLVATLNIANALAIDLCGCNYSR